MTSFVASKVFLPSSVSLASVTTSNAAFATEKRKSKGDWLCSPWKSESSAPCTAAS